MEEIAKTKEVFLSNLDIISRNVTDACEFIEKSNLPGVRGKDKLSLVKLRQSIFEEITKIKEAQIKIMRSYPHQEEDGMIKVDTSEFEACNKEIGDLLVEESGIKPLDVVIPEELMDEMTGGILIGFTKLMKVE